MAMFSVKVVYWHRKLFYLGKEEVSRNYLNVSSPFENSHVLWSLIYRRVYVVLMVGYMIWLELLHITVPPVVKKTCTHAHRTYFNAGFSCGISPEGWHHVYKKQAFYLPRCFNNFCHTCSVMQKLRRFGRFYIGLSSVRHPLPTLWFFNDTASISYVI
jgi:hypothetical protein